MSGQNTALLILFHPLPVWLIPCPTPTCPSVKQGLEALPGRLPWDWGSRTNKHLPCRYNAHAALLPVG